MSARQRARPVTVEHLKEVCEREQKIALEKKQRAIEKHQRREEKLQTIQAQKLAHAEAVQQARREKLSSDITRDSSGSLAAESRLEEVWCFRCVPVVCCKEACWEIVDVPAMQIQEKLENSLTLSGSVALLKANKAKVTCTLPVSSSFSCRFVTVHCVDLDCAEPQRSTRAAQTTDCCRRERKTTAVTGKTEATGGKAGSSGPATLRPLF
jgi:hypothetical protein